MNKRSDVGPVIASIAVDENGCFHAAIGAVATQRHQVPISGYRAMKISCCRLQITQRGLVYYLITKTLPESNMLICNGETWTTLPVAFKNASSKKNIHSESPRVHGYNILPGTVNPSASAQ